MDRPIPLIVYHDNCLDGLSAAWVVWKFFYQKVELFPAQYGGKIPTLEQVRNRDLIIVDFSFSYEDIVNLSYSAWSTLIIDHHKTSQEALEKLPNALDGNNTHKKMHPWDFFQTVNSGYCYCQNMPNIGKVFDMEKSGALLAWEFFFPRKQVPNLIEHISDRDLWKFNLPNTKEINAYLFSFPYNVTIFDGLIYKANLSHYYDFVAQGESILRKSNKDIDEMINYSAHIITIDGNRVPAINIPYIWASEACHSMCNRRWKLSDNGIATLPPFAAAYYDRKDGKRVFSLRSDKDGMDVSKVAGKYGGGGHKHAAGFSIERETINI